MNQFRTSPSSETWVRLLLTIILAAMLAAPIGQAQAAAWCECVQYIKNRYTLSGAIGGSGGAKDMGPYLAARGFVQISTPKVGAVMILKPAFGQGVNSTYGHVGVIASLQDLSSQWRINLRGANQGSSGVWTDYECTNVKDWVNLTYSKSLGSAQVEYWTRNLALGRPAYSTSIQGSGYEASRANDGSTATRWSSRITGPSSEWWRVDLQTARTFDRVNIRWEAAYARRYFVGWSNDGSNFTGYWYTASSAQNITRLIGTRTARYVGIYMTEKAPGLGNYSIWEVNVLANANPYGPVSGIEPGEARPTGSPVTITMR